MAWQQKVTDLLADILRFFVRGALILDAIAITATSVYIVFRGCWFFIDLLNRTIFHEPW